MVGSEPWVGDNPRLTTPERYFEFVRLWAACRGADGNIAHWPDPGGVNDQPAWTVEGFSQLEQLNLLFEKRRKELMGEKS